MNPENLNKESLERHRANKRDGSERDFKEWWKRSFTDDEKFQKLSLKTRTDLETVARLAWFAGQGWFIIQ
jgi:cephalosporin-C deacetylase-like acetyl esterase